MGEGTEEEKVLDEMINELVEQRDAAKEKVKWLDRRIQGLVRVLRNKYDWKGLYVAKDLDDG